MQYKVMNHDVSMSPISYMFKPFNHLPYFVCVYLIVRTELSFARTFAGNQDKVMTLLKPEIKRALKIFICVVQS